MSRLPNSGAPKAGAQAPAEGPTPKRYSVGVTAQLFYTFVIEACSAEQAETLARQEYSDLSYRQRYLTADETDIGHCEAEEVAS